ncbi:putative transcription factor C2C2-CO-like family [Helianthus annuus]|nr:putative transcription factor C2C2-CO-like family [Helianthus annuus]
MLAGKKTANAVGGKTARACDSCVRKRARWYCAADDAFLCQSCDASVHSANQLAGRHERVLLETVSKSFGSGEPSPEPTWHQGFTRRARTPRQRTKYSPKLEGKNEGANSTAALVPEIGVLEASLLDDEEEEEQEELLYRVPVYDPFETELCNASSEKDRSLPFIGEDKKEVKVEDKEVEAMLGFDLDATRETLDHWDFDYDHTSMMIKEEEKKVVAGVELEHMTMVSNDHCDNRKMKTSSITLRLNYEDVINAWADQGSPWTNGARPEINLDGSWPDFMGFQWAGNNIPSYGGVGGSDGGREARVSRYREKRRTRLFSKKIRYEVRKLNAEKRPRMKGRFVKRNL